MNNKNKVNLVFYSDFGLRRGKGERVWAIAEALYRAGLLGKVYVRDRGKAPGTKFEKYVISSIPGGNFLPRLFSGIRKYIFPGFPFRFLSENLFDFFTSKHLKKGKGIVYMVENLPRTLNKAKKLGFKVGYHCTVLHPQYNLNLFKSEFSKFNLSIKSINTKIVLKDFPNRLKILSFFDFITVPSHFAKENYTQYGISPEKIFVNPLGVDLKRFKPNFENKKEKIFLFIGSLSLSKGAHYLLEAWKQLNLKDAKLIVCGNKSPDDWSLIKKYWNLQNVEFPGFVDPVDYYRRASVFVFPSLSEGFPRVVIEAMASGLPVITTPPAAEAVRDKIDGFIIPTQNLEALKEKILYFYNNPDKAVEMGKNARQRAEEFTWEKYKDRFVKIIEQDSSYR